MNSECAIAADTTLYDPAGARVASSVQRILIIGSGPVGVRAANEILIRMADARVCLFSNEAVQPYNRVQLSQLLAGDVGPADIALSLPITDERFTFSVAAIVAIRPWEKCIEDALGNTHYYDKLIIATGARAHAPQIPGIELPGVYLFRSLKDAELLYARVARARHVVVLGGGLLGLEAARGLLRFNTQVTLIQQGPRLMNRQLDDRAAELLRRQVEALGICVITNAGVREILGDGRVSGVKTRAGDVITCDTVLICAGITPNLELARDARLVVGNGILVDDQMRTSDPDIFAIGECCEHQGKTYGLVNPGYEQASIAADVLSGGQALYGGTVTVSRLKVVGEQVVSFGEVVDLLQRPRQRMIAYQHAGSGGYRKLVVHKGKIIGALGIGSWPESVRIQEAFTSGRRIWLWQLWLFQATGRLWAYQGADDVRQWPASAIVCQCNGITQGQLMVACVRQSAPTIQTLGQQTGAGTVCGSCKPLLAQILGGQVVAEKAQAWPLLLCGSLLALLAAVLMLLIPAAEVSNSIINQHWFEKIWNDKGWKQVTGFSLLGMTALGMLMSLRKRLQWRWMGNFAYWRLAHAILGASCAALLMLHSGFHLGENLNQLLMLCFIGILLLGALAASLVSLAHRLPATTSRILQKSINNLHIVVAWPLPVLLAVHVFSVYYF